MSQIVVGIAEMAISDNPEDVIVTYSLGSCIGVTVYDPVLRIGGMIHCMLPLSKVDEEKAKTTPCMFVDTGIPLLLTELFKMGVQKSRAIIKVAGGANVLDTQDLFKIGERNYTILRKILWKNNMLIAAEHVGGNVSRTIKLEIATGRFWLRIAGVEKEL